MAYSHLFLIFVFVCYFGSNLAIPVPMLSVDQENDEPIIRLSLNVNKEPVQLPTSSLAYVQQNAYETSYPSAQITTGQQTEPMIIEQDETTQDQDEEESVSEEQENTPQQLEQIASQDQQETEITEQGTINYEPESEQKEQEKEQEQYPSVQTTTLSTQSSAAQETPVPAQQQIQGSQQQQDEITQQNSSVDQDSDDELPQILQFKAKVQEIYASEFDESIKKFTKILEKYQRYFKDDEKYKFQNKFDILHLNSKTYKFDNRINELKNLFKNIRKTTNFNQQARQDYSAATVDLINKFIALKHLYQLYLADSELKEFHAKNPGKTPAIAKKSQELETHIKTLKKNIVIYTVQNLITELEPTPSPSFLSKFSGDAKNFLGSIYPFAKPPVMSSQTKSLSNMWSNRIQ